jgi:hypothetical protein
VGAVATSVFLLYALRRHADPALTVGAVPQHPKDYPPTHCNAMR